MPVRRPCIERLDHNRACPYYAVEGESRCVGHERERQRKREVTASHKAATAPEHRKQRAAIVATGGPWTCVLCGKVMTDPIELRLDHIVNAADGGSNDSGNKQVTCVRCNAIKGNAERRRPRPDKDPRLNAIERNRRSKQPPWMHDDR